MKSKTRIIWMKLHTYIACFFLPIILLYVSTGVLYMLGFEGSDKNEQEYSVALPDGWPTSEAQAKSLIQPIMTKNKHEPLSKDFYLEKDYASWYSRRREAVIFPTDDKNTGRFVVAEHDLWKQLLIIHKGYAGPFFWTISIGFGLNLLFSAISGLILVFQLPKLKIPALATTLGGVLIVVLLFLLT